MRSLCFSPKAGSPNSFLSKISSPSRLISSSPSPSRLSFSESVMDRTLEIAEPIITKWNPDTTTFAKFTSLFYENRREARDFIKSVNNLQKAMHFLVTERSSSSASDKLVRAQNLMQIAMKRLQKEFYQLLSMNRAHLDPESVSARSSRTASTARSSLSDYDDDDVDQDDDNDNDNDEVREAITEVEDVSTSVMAELRLIAECMISSGYAKECVKIYKIIRKSIIDEGIYRLGVEKLTSSQFHKMNWESLEMRIKNWLEAVRIAVKTLFNGERILCDEVFGASDSIRESIFTEISKEGAMILFGFPEYVVRHGKKSPQEKVFRALDMYTAISNHWPEIESIFSFDSTSVVRSQAVSALAKLGEYVRTAVAEFETALQKDNSKSPVAGGGVHPLTIEAMNYLSILADYSNVLSDIFIDSPPPTRTSPLPESYFGISDSEESSTPAISLRFAWLILVCMAKLDGKAKLYKDVSLSYLFLANNLQYVVVKVRTSNLKYLLGDEWLSKQEVKVKQFASSYERLAWSHVINTLPEDPSAPMTAEEVRDRFKRFNAAFEQSHRKQSISIVPDSKLRDEIKVSIARKIIPVYREFYNKKRVNLGRGRNLASIVRYTPEDVGHHLSDLFFGTLELESSTSTSVSTSSHSRESRSRPGTPM